MEDPSLFFLTVSKQVEIGIATSGDIAWTGDPATFSQVRRTDPLGNAH